jgi:CHASE3 domain sensor protein
VIAFPAAATLAIACAAYLIGSLAERAEFWVNHTYEVCEEIPKLKASEIESSASFKGYLLTRDNRFIDRMRESFRQFDTRRRNLTG